MHVVSTQCITYMHAAALGLINKITWSRRPDLQLEFGPWNKLQPTARIALDMNKKILPTSSQGYPINLWLLSQTANKIGPPFPYCK